MSKCIFTPVLITVLVFLFVLNGCGRGMELQELTQQPESVRDNSGEPAQEDGKGSAEEAGKASGASTEAGEDRQPSHCLVHICGAVKEPGVYSLPEGSRVVDAIQAAGGLTEDASERDVNQAAAVTDGMQVVVPTLEEAQSGGYARNAQSAGNTEDGLVNINTADVSQLMTLPGIGQTRAEAIEAYRRQHGNFRTIEEIMKVDGIKEGSFAKLKSRITVG